MVRGYIGPVEDGKISVMAYFVEGLGAFLHPEV
jgi:hypothetical protein